MFYKEEEHTLFKNPEEQAINKEEDNFVQIFLYRFEEVNKLYLADYSAFKEEYKNMIEGYSNIKIPFSPQFIQVIDFLLDKYNRSQQNPFYAEYSLQMLYYFARSDIRFCEIIAERGFVEFSKKWVPQAFSVLFPTEIRIFNLIISNKETSKYFDNYNICPLLENSKKHQLRRSCDDVYVFISQFLQSKSVTNESVLGILELFCEIKKHNDYSIIEKIEWSNILNCLVKTKYFKPELFFEGSLLDFYNDFLKNPFHLVYIGEFYSTFILRYPKYRNKLNFDFYSYIKLLNKEYFLSIEKADYIYLFQTKFNMEFNTEEEEMIDFLNTIYNDIKIVIYNTLAFYLFIYNTNQKKELEANDYSNIKIFDFDNFIQHIPEDVQNEIMKQVCNDYEEGNWGVKVNSLYFLSALANCRPDIILKKMNIIEYINLYNDFIEELIKKNSVEIFLYSIFAITRCLYSNPNYLAILHEISETETLQSLRDFIFNPELCQDCNKLTLDLIIEVLNTFSSDKGSNA
ncbi:hypothetical protein M9Y10_025521 [Tritrichomonas musculus]|uniref:Uncharacterized protein n=1 Tax=Tritrichomonas musculus TaxID=1915356 RepID=A0ABR2H9V4_9EUKA